MKALVILAFLVSTAKTAFASIIPAPEIDAATGIGALTLISGSLIVLRARRKSKR